MAAPAIVGPLLAPLPTPIEALVSQWFHQDHPIENWDHYLERLVTMPVSDLWRSIDESKKKGGSSSGRTAASSASTLCSGR